MQDKQRTYFCIDMKTFYASVECAERGLDPFETNLVVADPARGSNALCLAITPRLKELGIRNRCRLSEIPSGVKYLIAPPRMKLYVDYAAEIYGLYLQYLAPDDIHVYSIDEAFLDVTDYLRVYKREAVSFAKQLMGEIQDKLHIPSTAGIGTNLYLAKIALDITAKHAQDRIGILTEERFRETLWDHKPLTDFWGISQGTVARLLRYGIRTMRGIANAPEELLYKQFGINAELMIDHAWGRESCRMQDIKSYRGKSRSVSFSQILPRDYTFEEARVVAEEMTVHGSHELLKRHVVASRVSIFVGYSKDAYPPTGGGARMHATTAVYSVLSQYTMAIFDNTTLRDVPIRRLGIGFEGVLGEEAERYDLFEDTAKLEKEKRLEQVELAVAQGFGRNKLLRGIDFMESATQRERNEMIGGHKAGYDESKR